MKVTVWDLKKAKPFIYVLAVIVLVTAVSILSIVISDAYVESDKYVDAMIDQSLSKVIVIDAGHGGEDCGAIGVSGVYEKDLNLEIAFKLGKLFENEGYAVVYTRTTDRLLYSESENIKGIRKISDLKNRCKIAAEYKDALLISIHMNTFSSAKYSGLQVYYSEDDPSSRALAGSIQNEVRSKLQPENNRTVKAGRGIYLLENAENVSALIECGFLSNSEECQKLSEKEYQERLSFAIFCGIIKYIETTT